MIRAPLSLACALTLSLALGGCGDDTTAEPGTFVAFQQNFAPYRTWTSLDVGNIAVGGHPEGHAVVYANNPVPSGCAWPVGTILVKEVQITSDRTQWELFAMVKRGGSYDSNPAAGWELFTLGLTPTGTPVITGRGVNPGADMYSGAGGGGCNGCHGTPSAHAFDSVLTTALRPRCPTR